MRFESVDRLPFVAFYRSFVQTYRHRWIRQGMPSDCNPFEYFGFDEATNDRATDWQDHCRGLEYIEPDLFALPRFEWREFEPEGEYTFWFDIRTGNLLKRMRAKSKDDLSVKQVVDTAVKTYEDWLEVKRRYDPHTPERYPRLKQYDHSQAIYPLNYPDTWEEAARDTVNATHLVTIAFRPGFACVSNAIGFERLLTAVIDESEWVHEMVDYFGGFAREVQRKAFETARIDYVRLDADLAPPRTVHGEMLISPDMFFDYEENNYRQFLSMAAANGVEFAELPLTRHRPFDERLLEIVVDSGLKPILLADAVGEFSLAGRRKEYGEQFPILGGMEVRVVLEGERAIDAMIDRLFTIAADSGVFPCLLDRYGEFLEIPLTRFKYFTQAFRKANEQSARC